MNQLIHDGVSYEQIRAWLAAQGHPDIIKMNISRWFQGGYQDWLEERLALQQDRDRYAWAMDMAERKDDRTMVNAARQLNAMHFFDAVNRMDSVELSKMLDRRPEKFISLLNTFLKHRQGVS